jgi:arabinose-5-phosphate isomerase
MSSLPFGSVPNPEILIQRANAVLKTEASAVLNLAERIDARFVAACRLMLACKGRVIVTGMGKSGHIAGKIAATLASTGTPAFFVHPGEAGHGDMGMMMPGDVVLALSYSGETDELLAILHLIRHRNIPLIAMTGNATSTLARQATVLLDAAVAEEACPLGLAPTSSTTAMLALGDALAVALLDARGFSRDDFALSHPSGSLGRRLLMRVEDVMHTGAEIPKVRQTALVRAAILEMTQKKLGMTAVVDDDDRVLGIFTDGDLRRLLEREGDVHVTPIQDAMTTGCTTVGADMLAAETVRIMQEKKINALLVVNQEQRLAGALNMHDLFKAGVV